MLSPKMQRMQRSIRINDGQLVGLAEKARYSTSQQLDGLAEKARYSTSQTAGMIGRKGQVQYKSDSWYG
jgi:hypothetical protein